MQGCSDMLGQHHLRGLHDIENAEDARRSGLEDGCKGRIVTKHGSVEVKVFVTDKVPEGAIFYPFHFAEAPANRLTGGPLGGASQTPAYKRTAARVERIGA